MKIIFEIIEIIAGFILCIRFWDNLDKSADERNFIRFMVSFVYLFFAMIVLYLGF